MSRTCPVSIRTANAAAHAAALGVNVWAGLTRETRSSRPIALLYNQPHRLQKHVQRLHLGRLGADLAGRLCLGCSLSGVRFGRCSYCFAAFWATRPGPRTAAGHRVTSRKSKNQTSGESTPQPHSPNVRHGKPQFKLSTRGLFQLRPSMWVSPEEIVAARTAKGGWTRATLARWGVPWPPPHGWRRELERRYAAAWCAAQTGR